MNIIELMPLLDTKSEISKKGSGNELPLTYNGKTQTRRAWAKEIGIHETTILKRIKKYEAGKMPYEDIFK